jgi:hypothetical protein
MSRCRSPRRSEPAVIMRVCAGPVGGPHCGALIPADKRRCPAHEQAENARRAAKSKRNGLKTPHWLAVRKARLLMDNARLLTPDGPAARNFPIKSALLEALRPSSRAMTARSSLRGERWPLSSAVGILSDFSTADTDVEEARMAEPLPRACYPSASSIVRNRSGG